MITGATGINMLTIPDGDIKEMSHVIGSKVRVTDVHGKIHRGTLDFVGTNELFKSWGLHVTVSRVPGIKINSVNDIVVITN